MRKYALIVAVIALVSCKKHVATVVHHSEPVDVVVGEWQWVQSNFLFSYLTPQSGLQKTLTFTGNGLVYVRHNDSTGGAPILLMTSHLLPLPGLLTDTFSYSFGPEPIGGGSSGTFNALITTLPYIYQFSISGDTLYLASAPGLPQPDNAAFVRVASSQP